MVRQMMMNLRQSASCSLNRMPKLPLHKILCNLTPAHRMIRRARYKDRSVRRRRLAEALLLVGRRGRVKVALQALGREYKVVNGRDGRASASWVKHKTLVQLMQQR